MTDFVNGPKVLFVTTPVRPIPTTYPPIAVLSIMQALKKNGYDNHDFFNIDFYRPSIKEAVEYVVTSKPAILAISAVVSTAYAYVKELSLEVKAVNPDIVIIVGGPVGASAEILLRKTGVDFVCISEGEPVMIDFLEQFIKPVDQKEMASVSGLVYLGANGDLVTTGYADPLDKSLIYDVDYEVLRNTDEINNYFPIVDETDLTFGTDPRTFQPARKGKRSVDIPGSKGCVAKCTFCHRWDKGIRYIPIPILMSRFKHCIDEYDVGFIRMADENFGTDKKWLADFCTEIKKLDVLWVVQGMRVNTVSSEQLKVMKEAGCVRCLFGMETGSPRMLKIMNKGVKIEDNYRALEIIYEHGLTTTIQLVIGMPGETNQTIRETADFLRHSVNLSKQVSPFDCSINYAQALPGTPLYEYARHHGFIADDIDGEEEYLIWISDKNAADDSFVIDGLSGETRLRTLSWRSFLAANIADAYIKAYGWKAYIDHVRKRFVSDLHQAQHHKGYFTIPKEDRGHKTTTPPMIAWIKLFIKHPVRLFPSLFVHSKLALYGFIILQDVKTHGVKSAVRMVSEHFCIILKKITNKKDDHFRYQSLRKMMASITGDYSQENNVMRMLRKGRW